MGGPSDGYAPVRLRPNDVPVSYVRTDDGLATRNECLGEGLQNTGQQVARQIEQGPPAEHAAQRGGLGF